MGYYIKPRIVLLSLGFSLATVSLSTSAQAEIVVPWTPGDQLTVEVTEQDSYDPHTGTYLYEYTLSNSATSLQRAGSFLLETFADPTNVESPNDWSFGRFHQRPIVSWSTTTLRPLAPGEADDGTWRPSLAAIDPGATLAGFRFRSIYPPGNVRFWVQGETPNAQIDGDESDSELLGGGDVTLDSQEGWTIGPVPPPDTCIGRPDDTPCDDGLFCNGDDRCRSEACSQHAGDPCPGPDGDEDVTESCDEFSNTCTKNDTYGYVCTGSEPCAAISGSDGLGTCRGYIPANAGTVCREPQGDCDVAEVCSGNSFACPADSFSPTGTPCTAAGSNPCAVGQCDAVGKCVEVPGNAGAVCGAPQGGDCQIERTCTGTSTACPSSSNAPAGTACSDDGNPCTVDQCDAAGNCSHTAGNAGAVCGVSQGRCDVPATCTGTSTTCPANSFQSSTTVCRAATGVCDVAENCTGTSSTCPVDGLSPSTNTCRTSAGACDVQEQCTGTSASCPDDQFTSVGTVCRESSGICDNQETCAGSSASCPADVFASSAVTCRAIAGVCDVAETCTGTSSACPVDGVLPPTSTCRASAGVCDVVEHCSGTSAACPSDQFAGSIVECRAAQGSCDAPEACSGSAATCPDNVGTICVPECPTTPLVANCDEFERGQLTLQSEASEKRRLVFRASNGPEIDVSELGNPQAINDTTRYLFCAYNAGSLISKIAVEPRGSCQKSASSTGQCWSPEPEYFRRLWYRDRARDPQNGLSMASFNAKRRFKTSVNGRGTHLQIIPMDLRPFANSSSVEFQVIRTTGTSFAKCWHVSLPYPDKNAATRFTYKSH